MASRRPTAWAPDWSVIPGDVLLEALDERRMTQAELSRRMNRPLKTINEIVKGKAAITHDTAIQLERALGIGARFWNNLERDYREHEARQLAEMELASAAAWAKRFPIKSLADNGLLQLTQTRAAAAEALLSFFRVSSPAAWERIWLSPEANYRSAPAFVSDPYAVSAWLRWGQVTAAARELPPHDPTAFAAALPEIRGWTAKDPAVAIRLAEAACQRAGVTLILLPEFPGTRLSGAAYWIRSDRPVIQLSLRYGKEDQIWFTFFHEADHVLRGSRRSFVDGDPNDPATTSSEETRADTYAREFLVPEKAYVRFVESGNFSREAVRGFASTIGIAPGIVVGRLHRDHKLLPHQLNDLKRPVIWMPS